MRTKKVNIFEEQQRWLRWHTAAGANFEYEAMTTGELVRAVYPSPLERWKGLIAPDGTVTVPDMDYYNTVTDPAEIKAVVDELHLGEQ